MTSFVTKRKIRRKAVSLCHDDDPIDWSNRTVDSTKFTSEWMQERINDWRSVRDFLATQLDTDQSLTELCLTNLTVYVLPVGATKSRLYFTKPFVYKTVQIPAMVIKEWGGKTELECDALRKVRQLILQKRTPNLILLYQASKCNRCYHQTKWNPCYVTILERGGLDVHRGVKGKIKFTLCDQFSFICQLLLTLHAIHEIGIAHTDVRDVNVLYSNSATLVGKAFRWTIDDKTYDIPCLAETPLLIDFDRANINKDFTYCCYSDVADLLNMVSSPDSRCKLTKCRHVTDLKFHNLIKLLCRKVLALEKKFIADALSVFKIFYKYADFPSLPVAERFFL
jgi:serine/threonine protein kinase